MGAIGNEGELTGTGVAMAELPLSVEHSRMLVAAFEYGCAVEVATIAAMCSVGGVFLREGGMRRFACEEGDHIALLNVFVADERSNDEQFCKKFGISRAMLGQAGMVRRQILKIGEGILQKQAQSTTEVTDVMRAITAGLCRNAALGREDGTFMSILTGEALQVSPNSVLFARMPRAVVFECVVEGVKPLMERVSAIEPEWLAEEAPHLYSRRR